MSAEDGSFQDLNLVDAAIFASLYDLTIDSVRAKLIEENPKFQNVCAKRLEERIVSLLHGESKSRMYIPPTIILERGKWKVEEEFALLRLAKSFVSDQQLRNDVLRKRYWFDFQCPTRVIIDSIMIMRDTCEEYVSDIVKRMATHFAQAERAAIECTFTEEDLKQAGVDPIVFEQWKASLEETKTSHDEEEQEIEVWTNGELIQALASEVSSLLQPKTATLASIVMNHGISNVARKHFMIGVGDTCDLDLSQIPGFTGDAKMLVTFRSDLWFYLENLGECEILINGYSIQPGNVIYLPNEAIIRVGGVPMMFRYNLWMIEKLKKTMALNKE